MAPTIDELATLLPAISVRLGASVSDRDDAVRQAGALLAEAGAVGPDYVGQMLEREHVVSTFVGEGIAMPHGTLTAQSEVRGEGLSVLILCEPVDWAGQPVTIVIGIAAHGRRYIALLSQLATALLDEGRAESLREATSVEQVRALLAS